MLKGSALNTVIPVQPVKRVKGVFEAKFEVPRHLRGMLAALLKHKAEIPHKFASSRVKTLYFDDLKGTSFFDSRDGQLVKRKYRLREYLGVQEGGAIYSIEVKLRDGTLTGKVKRLIYGRPPQGFSFKTFRSLISALEDIEGAEFNELRVELPEDELYPSAEIFYERDRFEDPREDARYNLDTNISMRPPATGGGEGGAEGAKKRL